MDAALEGLDSAQREAAGAEAARLIILAAAGSGKTRTIIARVRWLMARGTPPAGIVVTTFTRKAAEELQERLRTAVGSRADAVQVGTFHSHCLRWLREAKHLRLVGPRAQAEPESEEAARSALRRALAARVAPPCAAERNTSVQTSLQTAAKPGATPPASLEQDTSNDTLARIALAISVQRNRCGEAPVDCPLPAAALADLVTELRTARAAKGAWDFEDLQEILLAELREDSDIGRRIVTPLRHVLVDEAQDLSPLQGAILDAMAARGVDRTLVGDDWQSIYGFRAADPRMLVEAAADPNWCVRTIPVNYRSCAPIVQAAAHLIANNRVRTQKETRAHRGAGPALCVLTFPSRAAEVQRILAWTATRSEATASAAGADPPLAILVRTNALVRPFASAALRLGLPFRILGQEAQALADSVELGPLHAWIRLLLDDRDVDALAEVWTLPPRYLRREDLEGVQKLAGRVGVLRALRRTPGAWRTLATDLVVLRRWWQDPRLPNAEVLRRLLDVRPRFRGMTLRGALRGHLVRHLRRQSGGSLSLEEARTLATEQSGIAALRDLALGAPDRDGFVAGLTRGPCAGRPPRFDLGTIHQSKGREWETVWLPCWEEGILPDMRSEPASAAALEEERRVAYVAITRARDRLVLSRATTAQPSRFLAELGPGVEGGGSESGLSRRLSGALQRWFRERR